jgi:RNA polymerase sigma-70 factor (ECF subfamily)
MNKLSAKERQARAINAAQVIAEEHGAKREADYADEEIRACVEQKEYRKAFHLIVEHYSTKISRLSYSMLGDRGIAEEISQDVLLRIWRGLPGYRGRASVSTWVIAITRNACLTALKRRSNVPNTSIDEPAAKTAVEKMAASVREADFPDFRKFIGELPEDHRRVILLFYMEARSYEEVAKLLDMTVGTVKTWLHRARKALAAAITRDRERNKK